MRSVSSARIQGVRARLLVCVVVAACGTKSSPSHPSDPVEKQTAGSAAPLQTGSASAPTPEKVGVALQVEPVDANVMIDDLVVGRAKDLDPVFALGPGLHTLVITHPKFKTYRMEFSVTDKTETFTIHLDPKN